MREKGRREEPKGDLERKESMLRLNKENIEKEVQGLNKGRLSGLGT